MEVGYRHNVPKIRTQDEMTRKREEGPETLQVSNSVKYVIGSQTFNSILNLKVYLYHVLLVEEIQYIVS